MKIWRQDGKNIDYSVYKYYKEGDIEIFEDNEIWMVLGEDSFDVGPNFGGEVGNDGGQYESKIYFEEVTPYIKVVKNTLVARKMNQGKILEEGEKWLMIEVS